MSSTNTDFDAKLLDWLYGELDTEAEASFEAYLEAHPEQRAEAYALRETRVAFQGLPHAEPPTVLTAMLMQKAAAAVQPKQGVWSAIVSFFQPVILHPAASAMATLILLVGVAGTLHLRNGNMVAEPTIVSSEAERPESVPSAAAALTTTADEAEPEPPSEPVASREEPVKAMEEGRFENQPTVAPGARGYTADLASPEQEESLKSAAAPKAGQRVSQRLDSNLDSDKATGLSDPRMQGTALADGFASNAISGGALGSEVGTATLDERFSDGKARNRRTARDNAEGEAPAPVKRAAPKTGKKKAAAKPAPSSWEQEQVRSFQTAARSKRCRDAGRIANDIREKSPLAYKQKVEGSPEESNCSYSIARETKRRKSVRAKRSLSKKSKTRKGGKSVPKNAVAAPEKDSFAADTPAQEATENR
ncbi:MAG: hypothetical protein GY811_10935 [Myxococcales bacterium]|nr:hypothetical protein [Myxococcales bacterium]